MGPPRSRSTSLARALALRCPRCSGGKLFAGWFRMHPGCDRCGLPFTREPGFYLGSIYVNYGITVLLTGAIYAAIVRLDGSHEAALASDDASAGCLMGAALVAILLFGLGMAIVTVAFSRTGMPAGDPATADEVDLR